MAQSQAKPEDLPPFAIVPLRKTVPRAVLLSRIIDYQDPPMFCQLHPAVLFPDAFNRNWPLGLICFKTRSGPRIFLPYIPADKTLKFPEFVKKSWEHLVRVGGAVGLAVRLQSGQATAEDDHEHAVMYTIHEYARRMREYCARKYQVRKDLIVKGRFSESVIPHGSSVHYVDRLIDRGREEIQRGLFKDMPNIKLFVSAGLHAEAIDAAGRKPRSKLGRLRALRSAFYIDVNADAPKDRKTRESLTEGIYSQNEDRYRNRVIDRPDESTEAFREGHSGGHASQPQDVMRALCKSLKCTKQEARWALNEVAWASFAHAGRALAASMKLLFGYVEAANQDSEAPLTAIEKRLFEILYLGVPETAGIPLAILHDRLDLLEPWLVATIEQSSRRPRWNVLYTLLSYYTSMDAKRRELDRERKRLKKQEKPLKKSKPSTRSVPGTARVKEAVSRIRKRLGVTCGCKDEQWSYETTSGTPLQVHFVCDTCGREGKGILTKNDLKSLRAP